MPVDYNFSLDGVEFGIGNPVTVETFDTGTAEWRVQDQSHPVRNARVFGRDFLDGPVWTFNMSTDKEDPEGSLETLEQLATVWRKGTELAPGEVMALSYGVGGRERRIYGRPREWAAPVSNLLLGGYVPITANFVTADPLHYSEESFSHTVDILAATTGGFVFPAYFPLQIMSTGGTRQGFLTVGGNVPTYPVVRFNGPVVDPFVEAEGWRLGLNLNIGDNEYVIIDTQPWAMTVMRNKYTSVAGYLMPGTRLADARLRPGTQELIFGGMSPSGTAQCIVSWRSAWWSL